MPQMLRTDICRWPGRAGTAWYAACRVLCGGLWDTVYREIDSARYRKEAYDRRAVDHVLPPIINLILTHTKVIRPGYGQNFNRLIRLSSTTRTNERITPNLLYALAQTSSNTNDEWYKNYAGSDRIESVAWSSACKYRLRALSEKLTP